MTLQVISRADENVLGLLDDRLLLFTRKGPLTEDSVQRMESFVARYVPRATSESPVGALAVIPGDAGLSRNDLLERQRRLFDGLKRHEHVVTAFCVTGSSVQSMAMRAVVRLFAMGQANRKVFDDVEPAAQWLGARMRLSPTSVTSAMRALTSGG